MNRRSGAVRGILHLAWQFPAILHAVTISVSKQRPSSHRPPSSVVLPTAASPPRSAAFWRRRVFHNTYTRKGRRLLVNGWSVKIQHQGRRRTFSLVATSREAAAREAQVLSQTLRTSGWDAAMQSRTRSSSSGTRRSTAGYRVELLKTDARYWQARLIERKYTEARLTPAGELSVRIEHEGMDHYFPLGTLDREQAAAAAVRIYETIVAEGWEAAFRQFSREITVAVFWSTSPVACTYTTLFTFTDRRPADAPGALGKARPARKIFLVEADAEIRRTLVFWMNRQPGFECAGAFPSADEAQSMILREPPDLLLVNRAMPRTPVVEFLDPLKNRVPDLAAFTYGIYQDSDHIFITLSGVTAGYIFRRRKPTELFEPIRAALRHRVLTANEILIRIRDYFQSLFGLTPAGEEIPALASLTAREQEILGYVSKGFLDKEIASALGISIWTVHNHLKHIYEKLNVHNRTEALIKYLQK
jgi:DNA-binding NarL/FixJ family response regulator